MTDPHRIVLRAGEVLFAEGEPATNAFLVEAGEIEVFAGSASDRLVPTGTFHIDTGSSPVVAVADKALRSTVEITPRDDI